MGAAALGGFVACAALALVLLVFTVPTLRSRLLFFSLAASAPPESPDKFRDPPAGLVTFEQGGLSVRFDNLEGFAMASPDGGLVVEPTLVQAVTLRSH